MILLLFKLVGLTEIFLWSAFSREVGEGKGRQGACYKKVFNHSIIGAENFLALEHPIDTHTLEIETGSAGQQRDEL